MMVAVVAAIVAITMAARRILDPDPAAHDGAGPDARGGRSFIPLRINAAGVMPIVFAQSVIVVPGAFAQFSQQPDGCSDIAELFAAGHGAVLHRCRRS